MKYITKQQQNELEKSYGEDYEIKRSECDSFAIVPHSVIFSNVLTDGEKMFLIKLIGLANKKGVLYHSNETIAERLGCKSDNVAKYLGLLKKKKMLITLTVGISTKRVICLTPYN